MAQDAAAPETLSARPGKTTASIVAKLRRDKTRLSKMQDIAGCRIVVGNLDRQEEVLRQLATLKIPLEVQDLRATPHYGYRAVHVLFEIDGRLVELQVRTGLQHLWANLSEAVGGQNQIRVQMTASGALIGGGAEPAASLPR